MKHTVIVETPDNIDGKCIAVSLMPKHEIYLSEVEYSQEELEEFHLEEKNWILKCSGSRNFLADSDSGEDAYGYYCEYISLKEEMAIFDNGKMVGICVCPDGFSYSGNGRSSFTIDRWYFCNPFHNQSAVKKAHVILFAKEETYRWSDWVLLKRVPTERYESYIHF